MRSRTSCAPGAAWALAVLMMLAAVPVSAAVAHDAAGPLGLVPARDALDELAIPTPLSLVAAADPQETPAVVPLPPALGTGFVGLVTMGMLRVGRRLYRRR